MGQKRKWEEAKVDGEAPGPAINRPKAGTKAFVSGKAVRDGLATGTPQAFVSFRQQIVTPYSALPIAITHPTVVILQHYLDVSPTCDEVFKAWQIGHETKNEPQTHAAVELLSEIINVLAPVPFFRSSVIGLVNKIIAPTEHYHDYLSRLVSSGKRDDVYHGLLLSAACINVDPPSPSPGSSSSGRLAMKIWAVLVEGGSVRGMGKQLGMRRRNKDGMVAYGENDPYDRPDIRHLALKVILPLLSTSALHAHARIILPALYSGLTADPPVTVYRVLTALWNSISGQSAGLSRKTSLVLFQERSIEHLWQLLSREDKEETTGKTIAEIVSAFLEGITCTPGKGVCFPDEGWYPRRVVDTQTGLEVQADGETPGGMGEDERYRKGLHNRILANVVRKVGNKAVDDDGLVGEWIVKVFKACPELVSGYWPHSALAVEPRLNSRWIATMAYLGHVISLPPPPMNTFRQAVPSGADPSVAPFRAQPPGLTVMIESILPSPLTKAHLMKGLQHTDALVQHMTAVTLARGLQKLAVVQDLFREIEAKVGEEPSTSQENPWTSRRRELEMEIRKRVPELSVIIAFAQKAATMAPAEAETEEEVALAAKSSMLTEVALRLFSLCNRALPLMASEMKFDPGRLLVSASSASAEKRARREAREGSVVSDSGSVASVGTMGTAGMGGGFGQARGDVEGFEALSQLHVLQLLGEVQDWNWTNKAAGSQYTYLYHILLLRSSTRQPVTYLKTTQLLQHLLLPTMLFEHDPPELSIWLDALPRASEMISGPMLLVQQIHLLSFLDDCFRRCAKTPYRYVEDLFAVIPDFFAYTRPKEMISPLIMTILEQLKAKMMGQLIATEAAGVVINYLRRVLLGLVGKQAEMTFLDKVVERIGEMLDAAKDAGQARMRLSEILQEIEGDLALVKGKKPRKHNENNAIPRLLDEDVWAPTSFERTFLTASAESWSTLPDTSLQADAAILIRRARFVLYLLAGEKSLLDTSEKRRGALSFLDKCLAKITAGDAGDATDLKTIIFENDFVKQLFTSDAGDEYRSQLEALNAHLTLSNAADQVLAAVYVSECVDIIQADKKAKNAQLNLIKLAPWVRFVQPAHAKAAVDRLLKHSERIDISNSTAIDTLSSLMTATQDPAFAIKHLTPLIKLKTLSSVITLIQSAFLDKTMQKDLVELKIKKSTVAELLEANGDEAYELLSSLVGISVRAAKVVLKALAGKETYDHRLIPTIEILAELAPENLQMSKIIDVTYIALTDKKAKSALREAALRLLLAVAPNNLSGINERLGGMKLAEYDVYAARVTESLAQLSARVAELKAGVSHLLSLGVQWATRLSSNEKEMERDELEAIKALTGAVESIGADDLNIPQDLVEALITAVIQDRLDVGEVVQLAALLATRVELKASFIRQNLQALFDSPSYTTATALSSTSSSTTSSRTNFVSLLHALFSASTYVSCQPQFVEPLLSLYRGSMTISDRKVLNMFQLFEGYRKVSVGSILKYWSATGVMGSNKRALDALVSMEPGKVFATCQSYPLRRTLRGIGSSSKPFMTSAQYGDTRAYENGEDLYDPVFVMALFTASMVEGGISGLDWVEVLRSNVLGLTICGLSSRDADVRGVANYALAKAFSLIETTPFMERPQTLYTLSLLRHTLVSPHTRLSTLTTLFFAHALRSLANPSHFLYPLSSRFLLQRPVYDAEDVPMLYAMLYASDEGYKRERGWIVRLLKDGLRSEADWRAVRRRKTWGLLATLFSSAVDPMWRRSLLQAMQAILCIGPAARSLVLREGLFTWLSIQWTDVALRSAQAEKRGIKSSWHRDERALLLALAESACAAICIAAKERVREGKEVGEWVMGVERFIKRVLGEGDVDAGRLTTLGKMIYRLSELPIKTAATLLPSIVSKLVNLPPSTEEKYKEEITSLLFSAGLNVTPESIVSVAGLEGAIKELGWRALRGDAGKEVGEWVKRERRAVLWEQNQGE